MDNDGTNARANAETLGRVMFVDQWLAQCPQGKGLSEEPKIILIPLGTEINDWVKRLHAQVCLAVLMENANDGRVFTLGRQLRERGFKGNMIAAGDCMEDQEVALKQCGFDSCFYSLDVEEDLQRRDLVS